MGILNIDVNSLPESDTVPAGQYAFRIDSVDGPEVDKNGAEYLKLTYTITKGDYTNRKVFEGYVPLSGKSTLRKLLMASSYNESTLGDGDELLGLEFEAVIKVVKDDKYGEQNKISAYIMPISTPSGKGLVGSGKKK